jgi:hypothetical protein
LKELTSVNEGKMVRLAWVCDDIPGIRDVWFVMAEEEHGIWKRVMVLLFKNKVKSFAR